MKKNKQIENIEVIQEHITNQEFEDVMGENFMRYTYAVMTDRALPDVRDGLKPSQRRVLIAMNDLGLTSHKKTIKCAKICGDCSGNYHPHGEAVIYPTLTRMAQKWNMRYPLIIPQGNFGGLDPEAKAAAMRYTEATLSKYGEVMMSELASDIVPHVPNYDGQRLEPVYLPGMLPNLLLNGVQGIAVGVATKMPSHNLRELANLIEAVIKNPDIAVDEMIKIMPGPDFPLGGVLLGQTGVKSYYETGRGALQIEGVYTIEEGNKGNKLIVVSEMPYGGSPELLLKQVEQLVKDKKIDGIVDIKDQTHSDKNDNVVIEAIIEVNKNANVSLVLNKLLKHTCLRIDFSVNNTVLIEGMPSENVSIKRLITEFVSHRKEILTNKFNSELGKSRARVHILDGLINVTKHIKKVVDLIMNAENPEIAQEQLISNEYVETEEQAKAVLAITLKSLTKLEANGMMAEQDKLNDRIVWLVDVLGDDKKIAKLIIQEQQKLAKEMGDDRRTKIGVNTEDITQEDLIEKGQILISLTKDGYIKRLPSDTYKIQSRGGKGVVGAAKREDDEMSDIFVASTHDVILFFTNKGLVYRKKGYEIPQSSRTAKGTHLNNILSLNGDEKVTNIIPIDNFDHNWHLVTITTQGMIKRSNLKDYDTSLKTRGFPALKLQPKDSLIFAEITSGDKDIFIVTQRGKAIRYPETTVRTTGRMTAGVRALNLMKDDSIAQMLIIDPNQSPDILVVTEQGFGKRTESSKYRCLKGRFAKGQDTIDKVKFDRNGFIVGACTVLENDSIILLTTQGKIMQVPVENIRSVNRTSMGVRIQKLDAGDTVRGVTKIVNGAIQEEDEEDTE